MRDQLGLRRARWVYTGGAPLGPDTYRFFRSFGINLKQVWGSTELSGLAALQRDGEADPDTVGQPIPGSEIRIADSGEVLVRSGAVFQGYFQAARGDPRRGRRRRLVPHRRLRLRRPPRPSRHRRPRPRCRQARRRHAVRPAIHREQAQIQPLHRRGGGVWRPAPVCRGDDRDRSRHRRQLGRAPQPRLHLVPGFERQARNPRADRRRDRALQRRLARRRPHPPLSVAQQGIRRRRQRDHPHPQGAAPLYRREIRRGGRGLLRRRGRGRARHRDHLRGRPQGAARSPDGDRHRCRRRRAGAQPAYA